MQQITLGVWVTVTSSEPDASTSASSGKITQFH